MKDLYGINLSKINSSLRGSVKNFKKVIFQYSPLPNNRKALKLYSAKKKK